jgi:hypothetical protein
MAEPTKQVGSRIVISPGNKEQLRSWPDPTIAAEACWKAWHAPQHMTVAEIRRLVSAAQSYAYIFEISQKAFLPTHAAIRAHLAARAAVPEAS